MQQVSCGLSLITSQSAQSTAFCKQTALTSSFSVASMNTSLWWLTLPASAGEPNFEAEHNLLEADTLDLVAKLCRHSAIATYSEGLLLR
jgi:hypothetical protein